MPSFHNGAVDIAYLDEGEGEPIVLVHGFASTKSVNWVYPTWVSELKKNGRRVIALDNRGHGESAKLYDPADYTIPIMAGDIVALMDHLGIPRADIMGYSLGGRMAAWLALNRPGRLRSAILGGIGIAMIEGGGPGENVALRFGNEDRGVGRIGQVLTFNGLERRPVAAAEAGDIVAVTGVDEVNIGLTLCDIEHPYGLPPISVDEPTLAMNFQVNTSPFAGREGKFVTSRQLRERLYRELQSNVALRVEDTEEPDVLRVSGRGELHLTILIENMRREGYELAVSRPQVLTRVVDGEVHEPWEALTVDVEDAHQGAVMAALGERRAELSDMSHDAQGRVRLDYRVPARGLIGFQGEFLTLTRGTGLMSHIFDGFAKVTGEIPERHNGVLVSNENGEAVAYALFNLQERGRLFVGPGEKLYEGMIIGIHSRDNDLVVNPIKTKKLTNIRAAGKDDAILLTPPIQLTLEYAVEFIADDELVEVTPASIRIRKRFLREQDRKRAARSEAAAPTSA